MNDANSAPDQTPVPAPNYAADIPASVAQAAHAGTSMVPEQRGRQMQEEYASTLAGDYEMLSHYANTDAKKAQLEEEFARYRAGFRSKYLAWLHSRSRVMSTMITGGSNFPTRRNQKRSDVADRRNEELVAFRERALKAIKKTLTPELAPVMSGDDDAVQRLTDKIAKAEKLQEIMKAANVAIRKNAKAGADAQKAALVAVGLTPEQAAKLLTPDFMGRLGFPSYELTNNNANINRMKGRLEQISKAKATPETVIEGPAAKFEDNPGENRVRLYFQGKPDVSVRNTLKAAGFRWAPTIGAWQGYRNGNTLTTARRVAGLYQGHPCGTCGKVGEIVNQCGCDPNNLPTTPNTEVA